MKITKLIIFSTMLITLSGCFDPKDTEIPRDTNAWKTDEQFKWAVNKLNADEREMVVAYLIRAELGRAFGGPGVAEGTTLKSAIENQRQFREQELQKQQIEQQKKDNERQQQMLEEQQRDNAIRQIRKSVSVIVQGVTWQKAGRLEGEYVGSHFLINIGLHNKTQDDIAGVKGTLVFSNMFGETLTKIDFTYDGGIPADRVVNQSMTADYNQFKDSDKALRNADFNKLSVGWVPERVIFVNGKALSANDR